MAGAVGGAATLPRVVPDDERALVVRVQRGDQEAFNELARRYARRAFAIAYRIVRHPQDAEDLVQDAFVAALDGIASFDTSRPFAPWFFRIVVNRSLNAVSARSTRDRHVTVSQLWRHETTVDFDPAEGSEIRARFHAALSTLPEHQRLIVELSDIDGRSSSEIGEMMDLPRGTVRWHLHHARKTLRLALAILREAVSAHAQPGARGGWRARRRDLPNADRVSRRPIAVRSAVRGYQIMVPASDNANQPTP